ncbi:MAG: glycosyltransferase [Clostridia bacterium]|nr:glycosyltransferase [Clostridia bacterium]
MKKMLIVAGRIYGGGAERVLVDLINGLDEREYDITLYTMTKDNFEKSGITRSVDYRTVYESDEDFSGLKRIFKKIRNKILNIVYEKCSARAFYKRVFKEKYDIELAAIEGYTTRIVSGSTNPDSAKIAWLHTDLETNHWSALAFGSDAEEAAAYKSFDNVICVTENVRRILLEKFGDDIKTTVISNPIRKDNILALASQGESDIPKSPDTLRIFFLGRFQDEKGADRLLHAHKLLVEEGNRVELVMVGDGCDMPKLREYISENELQSSVHMTGYLDNPYVHMKSADLFVCPSRAEGFGLVLVEAMILDLPVVSTDCAGPSEILDGGKYGVITENSVDGIYNGIKQFIDNPSLLQKYSALSRERREHYGYERSIERFAQAFEVKK